jgi:hypothetical protein
MTTSAPPVVSLKTTADLVAFLPALAGMPVRNSLVVAPFEGTRASRAIRIGVPSAPSPASARRLASTLLGYLARISRCDSVVVAVYRDEPFAEAAPQWQANLGIITEQLYRSGYAVKDAAIVAADGWMPLFEGDPAAPCPLSDIDAAAQRMPGGIDTPAPHELPATDPRLADLVTGLLLDRLADGAEPDAFGILRRTDPPHPVDLLEDALSCDPAKASALTLARLIAQIDSEGAVDRTVLQIAFGPETGALSWAHTLRLRAEAAEAGSTPRDLLTRDHERGATDPDLERLGDMLLGQTRVIPSIERLSAATELLGRAIAHCRLPQRSWAMCTLAWVRWATGLTSTAHELVVAANDIDPGNGLVPVYSTVFDNLVPEWIFSLPPRNRADRRSQNAARRARRR